MTGSIGDSSRLSSANTGSEVVEGSADDQISEVDVVEESEGDSTPPRSANDELLREVGRQAAIVTAERRLDKNTRRVQKKGKELKEIKDKLHEMGLDERGRIPGRPGEGDVEAQAPGTEPWVVCIWQYCDREEGDALLNAALVAAVGVLSAAAVLASQVFALYSAKSNEEAAEYRISAGEAPGANSSRDTQRMNNELGDSASEGLLGSRFPPFETVVVTVGVLGAVLLKYYSTRRAILARIKSLAKEYEECSAEFDQLKNNVEDMTRALEDLNAGR